MLQKCSMAFWNRRPKFDPRLLPAAPAPSQVEPLNLNAALEVVLVKSVESQAAIAAKIGDVVAAQLSSLSNFQQNVYERAAKKRGGRSRAANANRINGKFAPGSHYDCRLCKDPTIADPLASEIMDHMKHNSRRERPATQQERPRIMLPATVQPQQEFFMPASGNYSSPSPYIAPDGSIVAPVNVEDVQTLPNGDQVVECPDCQTGLPHTHGHN
jgi:hypothetical protein